MRTWIPIAPPPIQRLARLLRPSALACALLLPAASHAVTVLVYYATADPWNGAKMVKLSNLLKTKYGAANVTIINTTNTSLYDPSADNWNAYDQVWDLRFREANTSCPYTYAATDWDYFSAAWQAKAQNYMQNCGNFFVYGENSGFPAKFQGVSTFLNSIGATTALNTCNATTGDAYQDTPDTLTSTLPGTTQLYTWAYGGIPLSKVNGTSYVNQSFSSDGVMRSVAAGWSGSAQMPSIGGTSCNIGRLFTVWDQSMWQSDKYDSNPTGKAITDAFYNGVADYLGAKACSCGTPTFTPTGTRTSTRTDTRTATRTATPSPSLTATRTATRTVTPSDTPTRTVTHTPSATLTPTPTVTRTASPSDTPTRTVTHTPSATRTATRTATLTATASATLTATPTATPSSTQTVTATASPTMTPSGTGSMTPSQTPSRTTSQTRSATPTASPTATLSFTASPPASDTVSPTVSPTPTATPTATPSSTRTVTATASPTMTPSGTGSMTPSQTPSRTASQTRSATPTASPTATPSFTASPLASDTVSPTITPSSTATPTNSPSATVTATPSPTMTPSGTGSMTPSRTDSPSRTASPSATPSATDTPVNTASPTMTPSGTGSMTPSRTATPSASPSRTASPTPSATPSITPSPTPTASWTASPTRTPSPTVTETPVPLPLRMTLTLYNSAGEVVRHLFEGSLQSQPAELDLSADSLIPGLSQVAVDLHGQQYAGQGGLIWNGETDGGQDSSGGIYYFKAEFTDAYGKAQSLIKEVQVMSAPPPPSLDIYNSAGERVLHQVLRGALAGSNGLRLDSASSSVGDGGKVTVHLIQAGGELPWTWDGRNDQGAIVSSGSYMMKLLSPGPDGSVSVQTKDFILLRAPENGLVGAILPEQNPLRGGGPLRLRFTPDASLELRVRAYSLAGELLAHAQANGGGGSLSLQSGTWASGIYLVEVEAYRDRALLRRSVLKVGVLR